MSARRVVPAVALLALLALAAAGVGLALPRDEVPAADVPLPDVARTPVAPPRTSGSGAPSGAPAVSSGPGSSSVPTPSTPGRDDPGVAPAAESATPTPAGRVRLTGRLVARRLEWAWVQARPAPAEPAEGEEADESVQPEPEEPDDDPSDVRPGADGVPTVAPRYRDLPAWLIGRPGGGWAVPLGATRVGATGDFALDLPAGPWVLLAGARGCATRVERLVLAADRAVTWTLAQTTPATLVVTFTSAEGVPLAGAGVALELLGASSPLVAVGEGPWGDVPCDRERRPEHARRTLDAAGRLLVELPPGDVELVGARVFTAPAAPVQCRSTFDVPGVRLVLAAGERREVGLRAQPLPGRRLDVRIVGPDGAPAAGATARLREWNGAAAHALAAGAEAEADAGGRLVFLGVEPGAHVVAARGGGRAGCSSVVAVAANDPPREVRVVLDEEDPAGSALVDVRAAETPALRLEDARVQSGPDGLWSVTGFGPLRVEGPRGRATVDVLATGRASRRVELELRAGRPARIEVRLAKAAVVAGRVEPAAEAQVTLVADGVELEGVRTAKDGVFRFDSGAAFAQQVELVVRTDGWFEHRVRLQAPAEEVVVRLPAEPVSEVVVTEADGSPAWARVQVVAAGRLVAEAYADEGRAVLRGPPPPGAMVRAWNAERELPFTSGAALRLRPAVPSPPRPDPVERTSRVEGTVTDGEGRPVAGARVWVVDAHDGHAWTCTDAAGRFEAPAVVGRVEVCAERVDLGRDAVLVDVPEGGATVVVPLAGCVQVRVRAPRAATHVELHPLERAFPGSRLVALSMTRGADGAFDLGRVRPGRWRLQAWPADLGELAWQPSTPVVEREVEVVGPGPLLLSLE